MGGSSSTPAAASSSRFLRAHSHGNGHGQQQQQQGAAGESRSVLRTLSTAFRSKYGLIPDNFTSIAQVQEKLREVGLESSNLIVGVDFTKSNEWTGKHSFQGRCLHALGPAPNPYEQAIAVVGEALSPFDEDNLIPCYGFGDVSTHDTGVFSFNSNDAPCNGFEEVLARYRQIVPHVKLSGPTSFGPIIEQAVRIVEMSGGQYHVLLIIADGQVTRSEDLGPQELSEQERTTVEAIVAASNYPLSIVMVGVGDGPWETMKEFDDSLPQRNFDNFQFVNCTEIMARANTSRMTREQLSARFALMALMEVPMQYKACAELNLIGKRVGRMPPKPALPPPATVLTADTQRQRQQQQLYQDQNPTSGQFHSAPFPQPASSAPFPSEPSHSFSGTGAGVGMGAAGFNPTAGGGAGVGQGGGGGGSSSDDDCPVCWQERKDMAFQCGHQTCTSCGQKLSECPICRMPIALRIRLYP